MLNKVPKEAGKGWIAYYHKKGDIVWRNKKRKLVGKYSFVQEQDGRFVSTETLVWSEAPLFENGFNMACISQHMKDDFFSAIKKGDIKIALGYCYAVESRILFVNDNWEELADMGLLTRAIYSAWPAYPYGMDRDILRFLLSLWGVYDIMKTDALPTNDSIITIYRGVSDEQFLDGFSWSLDYGKARYFATHTGIDGKVFTGKVRREDIIFYANEREEQELAILPENVFDIRLLP